jgi:hypothetical protein
MVPVGFSEFTYGFAFLFEQVNANWGGLTAAPILPSLQQEQFQGWDVSIPMFGVPFFYQFKIPQYLSAGNAMYIDDGTYQGAYYRIDLHRRDYNLQHRTLRQVCVNNPNTFYAAPEVNTQAAFTENFLAQTIVDVSRIIPLGDCVDILPTDGTQHSITYQQDDPNWIFHSEPHRQTRSYSGRDLGAVYHQTEKTWRTVDSAFALDLLVATTTTIKNVRGVSTDQDAAESQVLDELKELPRERLLSRVADVLAAECGLSMVLVGTK